MKQRNRPRKNTPHHVKVIDQVSGKVVGRVVDITADGLMLISKKALDPGNIFQLRIILPRMMDGKVDIPVEAEAVWSKQDKNPSYFQTGFRFVNLSGNDGYLLEDVMHRMNLVG
ncbi:MAG: PilZ domain-containing protein [bacterium]|nr:PilZ domain-containing protein [bacterium]